MCLITFYVLVAHADPAPIALYDLIEVPSDYLVFIVMEEWHPQFVHEVPCSLKFFLGAMRQCIEVRPVLTTSSIIRR